MNTVDLINAYPFWGPANAGPAKNFAAPYALVGTQIQAKLADLPKFQRIPQETEYDSKYLGVMQLVPAFVPLPQAPVQARAPFTQARTLTDYAQQVLGTSDIGASDSRGA